MKNFLLFLVISVLFINCTKQDNTLNEKQSNPKYELDETFRFTNLESDFGIHNAIMDELFSGNISSDNHADLIQQIINSAENKTDYLYSVNQKVEMQKLYEEYLMIEPTKMISKFIHDGMISQEAGIVLGNIYSSFLAKDDNPLFANIRKEIDDYKSNVIVNVNLTDFDKNQLVTILNTALNSAKHYKDRYESSSRSKCTKCISRHLKQILLADGVGAVILGGVACIIWPPACAAVIPALMAAGSGGVLAVRCPECIGR